MENKRKRLIVETGGEMSYCHNHKCNFLNIGVGCDGLEYGKNPKCCLCYKPTYVNKDGSGELGDTSQVDL